MSHKEQKEEYGWRLSPDPYRLFLVCITTTQRGLAQSGNAYWVPLFGNNIRARIGSQSIKTVSMGGKMLSDYFEDCVSEVIKCSNFCRMMFLEFSGTRRIADFQFHKTLE